MTLTQQMTECPKHEYGNTQICQLCGKSMGHDTWLFKVSQEIRSRYADGVPLSLSDMKIMVAILNRHPESVDKIGSGIASIVVHTFIGGTRCFFVVRTDHTVIDFSARKCLNRPNPKRSNRVWEMMRRYRYEIVYKAFMFNYRRKI
jgi:hypothetical protein